MKKIILTPMEENKYNIIKELVDHSGNKRRAALKLNCSIRTINRLITRYKSEGKSSFSHGNRGRLPSNTFSLETKNKNLRKKKEKSRKEKISYIKII